MKHRAMARFALALIPVAGAVTPFALPRLSSAATITPDTFADVASPDCTVAGHCSLRAAVLKANATTGAVIQLQAGTYTLNTVATGTDDGLSGDLDVTATTVMHGAGAQQTKINTGLNLAGAPFDDRVIELDGGLATLTITDLTITGGNDQNRFGEIDGGAIMNDAGILNVNNVDLTQNASTGNGGGIASPRGGTTTISNSTFDTNIADGVGGGLSLSGSTAGANSYTNLYFTSNTAFSGALGDAGGGGIYDDMFGAGSAAFSDIMATHNHAPGMNGGGIYEDNSLPAGVSYSNITLASNDARNFGGGLYVGRGKVILANATITGNSATGGGVVSGSGSGGGIAMILRIPGGITINNATINGNTGTQPGAGVALLNANDKAVFHNTIVLQNKNGATVSNCDVSGGATGAAVSSTGYNIADDTTCFPNGGTDRAGASFNPNLGVVKDNTGPADGAPGATSPTLTEALPLGSIAINTADPSAANNPATDERHVPRPQGAQSDVGAFEAIPLVPVLPAAGLQPPAPPLALVWTVFVLLAAAAALAERRRLITH